MADYSETNPGTHDPEYNTEAIHSQTGEPWFTEEEPADETYHPHDELRVHDYAPQERERVIGSVPAYTPQVNSIYEPDPHYPAPEKDNLHIVTYGTVEDVAYAEGTESRENGLVSMSIRDEMDDLIHTDFHTLNPLSLLSTINAKVGDRVRVDIQDYKNVIEWFVYNYPTGLLETDLLTKCVPDGAWFLEDMSTTAQGDAIAKYNQTCRGGSITAEPLLYSPAKNPVGEDWEHQDIGSQLDKSFIEIGQRDGNKKISIRQFLDLIKDYFQIDKMWETLRDHEKRLVHLERDLRSEDRARNDRVYKTIDESYYCALSASSNWGMDNSARGWPSTFVGNKEQEVFSLYVNIADAAHEFGVGAQDWWAEKAFERGGRDGVQIFKEGAIPEEFRPTTFQWIQNYGFAYSTLGAWDCLLNSRYSIDFGFDPDGSVWVDYSGLNFASLSRNTMGIFGKNGTLDHMSMIGVVPGDAQNNTLNIQMHVISFGGVVNMGSEGGVW